MKTRKSNQGQKPRNRGTKRQSQEGNRNGGAGDHTDFDCRIAMVHELSRTLVRHGQTRFLGNAIDYGEWTARRLEQLGDALRHITQEGKAQPGLCPAGRIVCESNRLLFENAFDVLTLVLLRTTTEGVMAHATRYSADFRKSAASRLIRAAAYLRGLLRRSGSEVSKGPEAIAA